MLMKIISLCLYNRPAYAARVLDHLSRCQGIEDYILMPCVEPGCEATRALVESINFAECRPRWNEQRLGVNLNTRQALDTAFALAKFVIHVEEDILLAHDALRYFEQCGREQRDNPNVFSIGAYNRRTEPVPPEDQHRIGYRVWFHPWGWATWRDRWQVARELIQEAWPTWDSRLNDDHVVLRKLQEVFPDLSRSQNIGLKSTIHQLPEAWFAANHQLKVWAGQYDLDNSREFHI
jgi:hypothetical protein